MEPEVSHGSNYRPIFTIYLLDVSTFEEQAGLGAAIVTGVGAGVYSDLEEGCSMAVRHRRDIIYPNIENHRIYQEFYELYKEAYSSNKMLLNKITKLGRGNISCTFS